MAADPRMIEQPPVPDPTPVKPRPEIFESPDTSPAAIDAQVEAVNKLMGATEASKPNNVIPFRNPNAVSTPAESRVATAGEKIGEQMGIATPGLIEQPVNPNPIITPVTQPAMQTPEDSPALGPKADEALQAAVVELDKKPIMPGQAVQDTVNEARSTFKQEQAANAAKEAASSRPVKFFRAIGRRLGLVQKPL